MKRICGCLTIIGLVLVLSFSLGAVTKNQGVSESQVVFGQTAAFKGHAGGLGSELWRGAQAYFSKINEEGGVNGRKIVIKAYDDSYDPNKTVQNTIMLIKKDNVFGFFGSVGTPTIVKMLPILRKFQNENVFLLTNFTGAQAQRKKPNKSFVFNLRASYNQETAGLVDNFLKNGISKIGIFVQNDAYGQSGADGVRLALAKHGKKIAGKATYQRGKRFDSSMKGQIDVLKKDKVDAVISVGAYQACAAFIRDARVSGWKVPIANLSFVGSESLLRLLKAFEKKTGKKITTNLINSQVVPSYEDTSLPAVKEYRALMDKYDPKIPSNLKDPKVRIFKYSFASFEGFLNAKLLVEALKKAGKDLSRSTYINALENLKNLDLGIGVNIDFSKDKHQGLNEVFFTAVEKGKYVPIKNWKNYL